MRTRVLHIRIFVAMTLASLGVQAQTMPERSLVRKGWMINWRNVITIKVLPEIPAEEVAERSIREIMAQVHDDMVNTLAELRAR